MGRTNQHNWPTPDEGDTDYETTFQNFFSQVDSDVEIRDTDANKGNYTPEDSALFRATDTGTVYQGDGTSWNKIDLGVQSLDTEDAAVTNQFRKPAVRSNTESATLNQNVGFIDEPNDRLWTKNASHYSDDGGDNWTATNGAVPSGSFGEKLTAVFNGHLYALVYSPVEIYRAPYATSDMSWSQVTSFGRSNTNPTTSFGISSNLSVDREAGVMCYGEYGDPNNGPRIYRSTDGTSWSQVHQENDVRHLHHIASDPDRDGVWIASTGDSDDNQFLESADGGQTWSRVSKYSFVPGSQAVAFDFGKDFIYFSDDGPFDNTIPWVYHRESGETAALASNATELAHPSLFRPSDSYQSYTIQHDRESGVTYWEVRNGSGPNPVRNAHPLFYVRHVGDDVKRLGVVGGAIRPIQHGDYIYSKDVRWTAVKQGGV